MLPWLVVAGRRWPGLRRSDALCVHLAALIRRHGGEIRYAAPVRGQRFAGGRIAALLLPDTEIAADQFVLTGGIESRDLLASA